MFSEYTFSELTYKTYTTAIVQDASFISVHQRAPVIAADAVRNITLLSHGSSIHFTRYFVYFVCSEAYKFRFQHHLRISSTLDKTSSKMHEQSLTDAAAPVQTP